MTKLALYVRIWLANRLLDCVRLLVPQAELERLRRVNWALLPRTSLPRCSRFPAAAPVSATPGPFLLERKLRLGFESPGAVAGSSRA